MPVYRYLDLSIEHLTEREADELCGSGPTGVYVMGDLDHSPRVIAHESGAWVQLPARECEGGDWGDLDAETLLSTRPNLALCFERAWELDCNWINFDQDAERDPDLPTFDW
jgi:hypothetical protein